MVIAWLLLPVDTNTVLLILSNRTVFIKAINKKLNTVAAFFCSVPVGATI